MKIRFLTTYSNTAILSTPRNGVQPRNAVYHFLRFLYKPSQDFYDLNYLVVD